MRLSHFLLLATVVYTVFGGGLVLAPDAFMGPYGLRFDAAGMLMSRVLGAALLGFALAFWLSRNGDAAALRPLLLGSLAYNLIDLPINVLAIESGAMNGLAWVTVGLHVVLALGFGWFGLVRR